MATTKSTTTAELVARYNQAAKALDRRPVKRFADRKTAERRARAIEAEARPVASISAGTDRDAIVATRGLTFNLPNSKDKTPPREGSMRATLLDRLQPTGKKGVSFQALHEAAGFANRRSTYDALRLLTPDQRLRPRGQRRLHQAQAELVPTPSRLMLRVPVCAMGAFCLLLVARQRVRAPPHAYNRWSEDRL